LKILIWSQYFWPETFRINDVATSFVQSGHQVTVLTGKPNYPEGQYYSGHRFLGVTRERRRGADIVRIPLVNRGRSIGQLAINYLSFVASGYCIAPFALRGKEFDVIFIYAPSPILQALPAFLLSSIKRVPTVLWVQDIWPQALVATGYVKSPRLLGIVERIVRHVYNRSTLILVQSEAFRASVGPLTKDHSKIYYLPNPAEETTGEADYGARASTLAQRMGERFAVAFTGNIGKAQSVETIIDAASRLRDEPDICFHLVGSGSMSGWAKDEIVRRGLSNVVLTERLPATDMPIILASASALLATLSDDTVGISTIPSKLQSYLAAGRPIIASMNGEGARIVREAGAGLTCPAEDSLELAKSVMTLRAMTVVQRDELGANARRYFLDNFELKSLSQRLTSLLEFAITKAKETNQ
jgi:glycosyltransferase involved in cell wall biosynthesis